MNALFCCTYIWENGYSLLTDSRDMHSSVTSYEQISVLLRSGCDAKVVAKDGNTALHHACNNVKPCFKSIEALIKAGADPSKVNKWGFLPIQYVIDLNAKEKVCDLIIDGKDV